VTEDRHDADRLDLGHIGAATQAADPRGLLAAVGMKHRKAIVEAAGHALGRGHRAIGQEVAFEARRDGGR